jgi:hypothetical protein
MAPSFNISILLDSTTPPPVKSISSSLPVLKQKSYDFSFSDYEEEASYDDQDIAIQQEDEFIQIAECRN